MDKEGIGTGEHVCQTEGDGEVRFNPSALWYLKSWIEDKTNDMANNQIIDRLRILKEKLKKQRQHLDELDAHMYVPCSNVKILHLHTQFILEPSASYEATSHWCTCNSDALTKDQGGEHN